MINSNYMNSHPNLRHQLMEVVTADIPNIS